MSRDERTDPGARRTKRARLVELARSAAAAALVGLAALSWCGAAAAMVSPSAHTARTITVNETGRLHLVGKPHGFTLYEEGSASGTFAGTIYVRLTAVSTSRVTAEVTIRARHGSVSGYATASYHSGRTVASFNGSMSLGHGTGSYTHAHGSGLSFSGTIARANSAITVRVSGRAAD